MLKETIKIGLILKIIKKFQLEDINVDTTVQEKNIRFPTDSRLIFRAIIRLVKLAYKLNVRLRFKYIKISKHLLYTQIRYMNTEQIDKIKQYGVRLRICLSEIIKDFETINPVFNKKTIKHFITAERIYYQKKYSKNKVYSFHEPEVGCIAKGKLHKKYEFGNKVSIAATSFGGWIVGAKAFHNNPYDGHTLLILK